MLETLPPTDLLIAALFVGLLAGLVKGLVGFALPVIIVSGLGMFLDPELALAGLVVPSVLTNLWQAMRQGPVAAVRSLWKIRLLFLVAMLTMAATAQFVPLMSTRLLYVALGLPIVLFCMTQLAGWRPQIAASNRVAAMIAGAVSGVFGGLAGMFGPPLVVYFTAVNTPKTEQIRTQGALFATGILLFTVAHAISGIVRVETLVFSALIAVPSAVGTYLGFRIHDRVNQATFRRLTLLVLLLSGANLLRRAWIG